METKTIGQPPKRNAKTTRIADDIHAWVDHYLTDDTFAYAIVAVEIVGFGVKINHKSAATPNGFDREQLASAVYRVLSTGGKEQTVDSTAYEMGGVRILPKMP